MKKTFNILFCYLLCLSLLLLFLPSFFACSKTRETNNTTVGKYAISVIVVVAKTRLMAKELVLAGTVLGKKRVDVFPKVKGVVMKRLLVDVGDHVRKGQVLAVLEDTEIKTRVAQATAALRAAKAKKEQVIASLKKIEKDRIRYRRLLEKGAIAKQQVDHIEADYMSIKAALNAAKANVNLSKANLETLRVILGYYKLKAPISGEICAKYLDEGSMMDAKVPILGIVDTNNLKIVTDVDEGDLPYIKKGQKIAISSTIFPQKVFTGYVKYIYPVVSEQSRTARIEIALSKGVPLRPGMFANIHIRIKEKPRLSIPLDALKRLPGTGTYYVFTVGKDNIAHKKNVSTGIKDGKYIEILEGISSGDMVVKTGQGTLKDGVAVNIKNAPIL